MSDINDDLKKVQKLLKGKIEIIKSDVNKLEAVEPFLGKEIIKPQLKTLYTKIFTLLDAITCVQDCMWSNIQKKEGEIGK